VLPTHRRRQRTARELAGDARRGAFGVLAETYHITKRWSRSSSPVLSASRGGS
jgi:hypothetical protein